MTCKGKCNTITGYDPRKNMRNFAQKGYRKCRTCECHFNIKLYEEIFCGCCSAKLAYSTFCRQNSNKRMQDKIKQQEQQQELLRSQALDNLYNHEL